MRDLFTEFLDGKSPKATELLLTRHDDDIPETEYEVDLPYFEDAVNWVRRFEDSTGFDYNQAGHHAMLAQGFSHETILRKIARTTFFGIPAFKGHIPRPMRRKLDINAITTPYFIPYLKAFAINSRRDYQKHEFFQAKSLPKAPFNYKLKSFMDELRQSHGTNECLFKTIELDESGNLKRDISGVMKSKRIFVADLKTKEESSRWVHNWEKYSQFDFIRCEQENSDTNLIDKFCCCLKSCTSFILFMRRKPIKLENMQHMNKTALIVVSSAHDHSVQRISRLRKKFLLDRFSSGYGPHRAYYHWIWHNASRISSLDDIINPTPAGPVCSHSVPCYLYHQWRENNSMIASDSHKKKQR
ncbi:hypothetical protein Ciccas_002763 [Cichlidogyrus casuarinus]|uniref:Uncharacterized protein n=1 Tax=Cichlidogyrus casuarinus TaxID=1844966 RepID=A0ABD2QHA5_9PLAT